jgi:hypothetical protein
MTINIDIYEDLEYSRSQKTSSERTMATFPLKQEKMPSTYSNFTLEPECSTVIPSK